jgi:hypothetical protein
MKCHFLHRFLIQVVVSAHVVHALKRLMLKFKRSPLHLGKEFPIDEGRFGKSPQVPLGTPMTLRETP